METGSTPLFFAQNSRDFGCAAIVIKDESFQSTGTYKDRRSAMILQRAMREDIRKLVLISAGNAAYSLATLAKETAIAVIPVVDQTLNPAIKNILRRTCYRLIEADLSREFLDSERLTRMVRETPQEHTLDVTNDYHDAYRAIISELAEQLPCPPDIFIIPRGSGEAMYGCALEMQDRGWNTRVIGVGSQRLEKLRSNFDPYHERISSLVIPHEQWAVPFASGEESLMQLAPGNMRAEQPGRLAIGAIELLQRYCPELADKRVVVINSGYGKILDEAASVAEEGPVR